jgi:KipI family sensor histidine kinase inhibitor
MTSDRLSSRRVASLGDGAGLVFTSGSTESQGLATAVRAAGWLGVEDVVPAQESLGILVDPEATSVAEILELAAALPVAHAQDVHGSLDLEVCFDGADLRSVARLAGMSVGHLVGALESATLSVGWLGFMPGFPYLLGLPDGLASVPRLERPRARVPAGAFAIANGYAGIYPAASPGGWNVLGSTGVRLFDGEHTSPALLSPGDVVRIRAVASVAAPHTTRRAPICANSPRRLSVIEAGSLSLVQDGGRFGVAHLGVPRAGPADPLRQAIANIAVGNTEDCATLEIAGAGATLKLGCDAFVALVGDCPMRIDDRPGLPSTTQLVERGQALTIGAVRSGFRAYLGVSGGLEVPRRFGSRSADAVTGIWPGPLRQGERDRRRHAGTRPRALVRADARAPCGPPREPRS